MENQSRKLCANILVTVNTLLKCHNFRPNNKYTNIEEALQICIYCRIVGVWRKSVIKSSLPEFKTPGDKQSGQTQHSRGSTSTWTPSILEIKKQFHFKYSYNYFVFNWKWSFSPALINWNEFTVAANTGGRHNHGLTESRLCRSRRLGESWRSYDGEVKD